MYYIDIEGIKYELTQGTKIKRDRIIFSDYKVNLHLKIYTGRLYKIYDYSDKLVDEVYINEIKNYISSDDSINRKISTTYSINDSSDENSFSNYEDSVINLESDGFTKKSFLVKYKTNGRTEVVNSNYILLFKDKMTMKEINAKYK